MAADGNHFLITLKSLRKQNRKGGDVLENKDCISEVEISFKSSLLKIFADLLASPESGTDPGQQELSPHLS